MIYILFGTQDLQIKNRIKKIIRDNFNATDNITKIDLLENNIGYLIDEYDQMSLTGDTKVIIANNAYFLEEKNPKNKFFDKKEYAELVNSIVNVANENTIIFTINAKKLDSDNEIVKFTKNSGKILEFKEITKQEWPVFVNDYFKKRNINIESEAKEELIARSKEDLNVFVNEANKLILYKGNNITLDDVFEICSAELEDDIFGILNNLIDGNKEKAIKVYRDLRLKGAEPVTLINLVSSSIISMLNVSNLIKLGKNNDEIAKITGFSSGKVFMTTKNLRKVKEERLKRNLDFLYNLDYKIKHSLVDRFYAFEIFLTKF